LADVGNLDEFEGGLVEVPLELFEPVEVAVGLLDDDVAFEQEAFEDSLDIEPGIVSLAGSEGNVLQIEVLGFCAFITVSRTLQQSRPLPSAKREAILPALMKWRAGIVNS
jgi:hypothetical protein